MSLVDAFASRRADDRPGLTCEGRTTAWSTVFSESVTRAEILGNFLAPARPPQFAVFVDDAREHVLWQSAALLSSACIIGLDPSRHTSATSATLQSSSPQFVIFDEDSRERLPELDVDEEGILDLGSRCHLAFFRDQTPVPAASGRDPGPLCSLTVESSEQSPIILFMTESQVGFAAHQVVRSTEMTQHEVLYDAMPFGCANSVLAIWAPAIVAGAEIVVRHGFAPEQFLLDAREFNCTYFTFTGQMIQELLDRPRSEVEADLRLRVGFGTGSTPDQRRDFLRRFGCELVDADRWRPKSTIRD